MDGHCHDWQVVNAWGVILGVSRCRICGVIATRENINKLSDEKTDNEKIHEDSQTRL